MSKNVDVYTCGRNECGELFVVAAGKKVTFCPICGGVANEWSHQTSLLSVEEYKNFANQRSINVDTK